jgi:hypothetical protein
MPVMVKSVISLKRSLALALPLCLLWAMVSCVFVCASHIEDSLHQDDVSLSVHQLISSPEDCCPIAGSTRVRPERLWLDTDADQTRLQMIALEDDCISSPRPAGAFSPAYSPPFARLCTLRI